MRALDLLLTGGRGMPPLAKPGEVNHGFVDRFTLAHAGLGAAYGWLDLGLAAAFLLAVLWEVLENPFKAWCPALFPHATRDTRRNMLGDVLAVLGGWWLAGHA